MNKSELSLCEWRLAGLEGRAMTGMSMDILARILGSEKGIFIFAASAAC